MECSLVKAKQTLMGTPAPPGRRLDVFWGSTALSYFFYLSVISSSSQGCYLAQILVQVFLSERILWFPSHWSICGTPCSDPLDHSFPHCIPCIRF